MDGSEILDGSMIAIVGRREITVDGFGGIEEYSEREISFKAGGKRVTVCGSELEIRYMSIKTIVVAGVIDSVSFAKE